MGNTARPAADEIELWTLSLRTTGPVTLWLEKVIDLLVRSNKPVCPAGEAPCQGVRRSSVEWLDGEPQINGPARFCVAADFCEPGWARNGVSRK